MHGCVWELRDHAELRAGGCAHVEEETWTMVALRERVTA